MRHGTVNKSQYLFQKSAGRKGHVAHDAEPFFFVEKEPLFKAVEDGRRDEVFAADVLHGQMPVKVITQDLQDHGKGIRQTGDDKIRQECMGLSAGALHAGDSQTENRRLPVREGNKVPFIAASFAAGSFCATVRAGQKEQGCLQGTLLI